VTFLTLIGLVRLVILRYSNAITTNKGVEVKIEKWDTKHGVSVRIVDRETNGKFINNKSARQLFKIQTKTLQKASSSPSNPKLVV
jgi:hypothetical protein